jgi:hypothetical protein
MWSNIAAHKRSLNVHQIFPERGNMGKVLPEYLSSWTTNMVQKEGVNVVTDAEVKHVERAKDQLVLSLNNGNKVIMIQTFLIKICLIYSSAMLMVIYTQVLEIMLNSASKYKSLLDLRFPQL